MGEIAAWCLNENPVGRPEMREIVALLSQLMTSAVEWEASLGGNSQVFSGLFTGR
uniref:Serine-threonine/tyrosine-protein kinase catalytic domain-containing protein n=2 Tax=Cucumis sativus TaxID=3659 RepID=A0A0A0KVJ0_CUCSA